LKENVKNPLFIKLLEESEIRKIYGDKKEDEYTRNKKKKAAQLPQPYTEVDFVLSNTSTLIKEENKRA
jgi:hypothetical protein